MRILQCLSWLLIIGGLTAGFCAAAVAEERVRLTHQHVDLRIQYAPGTTNELFLVAHDEDAATNYASTNVLLVVRPPAETTIPPGFDQFGEPGSPFWILPASQDPELLYLGVSAEGLPAGVFEGPLTVRLISVQAAGWFFVWQFDPGGGLEMKMDSRNGIGPDDSIQTILGSHAHFNWGFSSNDYCAVTMRVEGRLAGASTNLPAADTTFIFSVEPLTPPPVPPAQLSGVTLVGSRLVSELTGRPGAWYRLQTSVDLRNWDDGPEIVAGTAPVPVSVPLIDPSRPLFLRAESR